MKKKAFSFMLMLALLLTAMVATPVYANENATDNLAKSEYEQEFKTEIQKDLEKINEALEEKTKEIDFSKASYHEFDILLNDGHISTIEIEIKELPQIAPFWDFTGTYPVNNYTSYVASVTIQSPFASKYAGGSLKQNIYYSTLGNDSIGFTKLSYTSTDMEATPPQACAIVDKNSSKSSAGDYGIICNGFVTISASAPWTVYVNVYTYMEIQAYGNSIGLGLNYSL